MTQERQSIEELYKIGYTWCYAWLTRGWNFLHPNGTFTYQNGWIDGINTYVQNNKLD